MAIKVKLRQKKISNGRKSLYLDFYPPILNSKSGKYTRREFLNLYIFQRTKSAIDKLHNSETLLIADGIRQKKENILNKPEIYTDAEKQVLKAKELGEKCFVAYYKSIRNKKEGSTRDSWSSAFKTLVEYTGGSIIFADINEVFLEGYKSYLLKDKINNKDVASKLSKNSASTYFKKIRSALRNAYREGLIQVDYNLRVDPIKYTQTRREYLSYEELNTLYKTYCQNDILKRASIFSALTGLRFSDIQKMRWNEIEYINGRGYVLNYTQKKTKEVETLPISEQAFNLLGKSNGISEMVFEGLNYSSLLNNQLKVWISFAGITKKITFHCFRHTYATIQLQMGTDIYTISKMLGHSKIETTSIYAKLVDESKRKAANAIILDM